MSKFDYDTFKNDDSWAGDFARFSDDFETVLEAMIGGDKYYEPGELLYEESEEPIKRLVFEVRRLLGEYHSEHMRDPRAHDLVQAHDVLLGAVLLERHMWEAMLEGRREDLDDVVARLPGLLDTLDGPHRQPRHAGQEGLSEKSCDLTKVSPQASRNKRQRGANRLDT